MTAFLFIPSATGGGPGRRVDFAALSRLFSEGEEQAPQRDRGATARVALLALILLGAIGDTFLVARASTLDDVLAAGQTTRPVASGRT